MQTELIDYFLDRENILIFSNEDYLYLADVYYPIDSVMLDQVLIGKPTLNQYKYIAFIPYDTTFAVKAFIVEKWHTYSKSELREFVCNDSEFKYTPIESDSEYKEKIYQIIEDIKNGDYYLLNLVRYFSLDRNLSRSEKLAIAVNNYPKMFSWLEDSGESIFSLSPECFIRVANDTINTFPIKGTIASSACTITDQSSVLELQNNPKEQAELAMIVDLMRHDLQKLCEPQSVKVLAYNQIQTFKNLHHQVAQVCGKLKKLISFGDLRKALLPSGSITGAPKLAVMNAIKKYEARSRGFFMGNVFMIEPNGNLDSSVLIRTLVSSKGVSEYAAGGGITIKSNPTQEIEEVYLKCKTLQI